MPGVQQFVTRRGTRLAGFLQSRPKTQRREISVPMRMFINQITYQPGSRIYLTHLITIMMIRPHTATERKSLVNGIVEYSEIVLLRRLILIVIHIIGKAGKHGFNIIP